jgi:hypothetical protein
MLPLVSLVALVVLPAPIRPARRPGSNRSLGLANEDHGSETSSRFSIRIDENRSALLSQRTVETPFDPGSRGGQPTTYCVR